MEQLITLIPKSGGGEWNNNQSPAFPHPEGDNETINHPHFRPHAVTYVSAGHYGEVGSLIPLASNSQLYAYSPSGSVLVVTAPILPAGTVQTVTNIAAAADTTITAGYLSTTPNNAASVRTQRASAPPPHTHTAHLHTTHAHTDRE
jgi:hypothetical protein